MIRDELSFFHFCSVSYKTIILVLTCVCKCVLIYVLADFNQPLFITHLMNGLHEEGRRQKKKVMVRFIHQVSFNFVAEQLA